MKAIFLNRIAAFILDYLIIYFVLVIICSGSANYRNNLIEETNNLNDQYASGEIDKNEYIDGILKINYDTQKNSINFNILSTVISIGYYVVFCYLNNGQTVGKKIFGIRIVSKNGKKVSIINIIIRSLFIYGIITNLFNSIFINFLNYKYFGYGNIAITYLEIIFIAISLFMIFYRKDNKGLHDLIANTYVVREEKK